MVKALLRRAVEVAVRPFGYRLELIHRPSKDPSTSFWFEEDTLRAKRNTGFLRDPRFIRAYERAVHVCGFDFNIRWRTHTVLWAAESSLGVPGDFVELGTGKGWMFTAVLDAIDWDEEGRSLFLCDRFVADDVDPLTGHLRSGVNRYRQFYTDDPESVREAFAGHDRVHLVVGDLPGSLDGTGSGPVAFVHVDLNAAEPEVESLERLWPRISPGGMVVIDDYAFADHRAQYDAHNRLADRLGYRILTLPTGQGLIVRR